MHWFPRPDRFAPAAAGAGPRLGNVLDAGLPCGVGGVGQRRISLAGAGAADYPATAAGLRNPDRFRNYLVWFRDPKVKASSGPARTGTPKY